LEGSDSGSIIKCFIQQGLLNSMATIKELEFAEHVKDVLQKQGVQQPAIDEIVDKLLF
jgi:hypothetical protein